LKFFWKKISKKLEKLVKSTLRKKKIQKISNFFVKKWQSFARKKNTSAAKSGYWHIIFVIFHCHSKTFYHLGFVQLPTSLSWTNNLQGRFKEGELILGLSCGWIFVHPKLNPNFATSLKLKVYILFLKWSASSLFGHRKTKNYMKVDLKGTCVRKRDPCEGPCTFVHIFSLEVRKHIDQNSNSHYLWMYFIHGTRMSRSRLRFTLFKGWLPLECCIWATILLIQYPSMDTKSMSTGAEYGTLDNKIKCLSLAVFV